MERHSVDSMQSRENRKIQWELNPRPLTFMCCVLLSELIPNLLEISDTRSLFCHALLILELREFLESMDHDFKDLKV